MNTTRKYFLEKLCRSRSKIGLWCLSRPSHCNLVFVQFNKSSIRLKKSIIHQRNDPLFVPSSPFADAGAGKSKTSTIEVTTENEKEVMTLDDEETFGNFYKPVSPSTLLDSSVILTEEDLSQVQATTPK